MKKDFNDAIMKLEDFCKTYKALSMEDKLLFAVLGPNGSDVAATVANEINEPKDPKGGLTDDEFSKYSHFGDNDYKDPSSLKSMGPGDPGPKGPDAYLSVIKRTKEGYPYNPVCCDHCDCFDCPFEESETHPNGSTGKHRLFFTGDNSRTRGAGLTSEEWEDAVERHIDPRDFIGRTIEGTPLFANKKSIIIDGEVFPLVNDHRSTKGAD